MRSSSITIFSRVSERTRANSSDVVDRLGQEIVGAGLQAARPGRRGGPARSPCTTGMWWVAGSSFSRRQTSKPSMPGIITSSRTMSGIRRAAIASASAPFEAVITSKYSADSLRFQQPHVGGDVVDDQDARGHARTLSRENAGRSRGTCVTEIGLDNIGLAAALADALLVALHGEGGDRDHRDVRAARRPP